MTGVHCLQHVERLRAAALAHDDPIRPHAQAVAHQVADGDRASSFHVLRLRLEADHVHLPQPELGRVLTRDDPLVGRDEAGQHIEEGGLA